VRAAVGEISGSENSTFESQIRVQALSCTFGQGSLALGVVARRIRLGEATLVPATGIAWALGAVTRSQRVRGVSTSDEQNLDFRLN
jgi:hypothetical protein